MLNSLRSDRRILKTPVHSVLLGESERDMKSTRPGGYVDFDYGFDPDFDLPLPFVLSSTGVLDRNSARTV